ncbi:uncharacterized protein B0I36DRAFT_330473 [Microdochium trichocladiopsis]|uniref:Uncharacterized protein n=1 Tax=Microdochium trichocladiopsis TaxID=1682393 RepID=A0A9P9BQY2_9PEZI|nr:uncharacterized protein B0I36DRAFT_330473 [Microdochium trichocladiopsis]KAH7026352.1 hypothetical protein B0I36DRAFT_330473 [Microdochium trichocladiopsis]
MAWRIRRHRSRHLYCPVRKCGCDAANVHRTWRGKWTSTAFACLGGQRIQAQLQRSSPLPTSLLLFRLVHNHGHWVKDGNWSDWRGVVNRWHRQVETIKMRISAQSRAVMSRRSQRHVPRSICETAVARFSPIISMSHLEKVPLRAQCRQASLVTNFFRLRGTCVLPFCDCVCIIEITSPAQPESHLVRLRQVQIKL